MPSYPSPDFDASEVEQALPRADYRVPQLASRVMLTPSLDLTYLRHVGLGRGKFARAPKCHRVLHHAQKRLQSYGLHEVRIGPQLITLGNILRVVATRQYHHRQALQRRVLLQLC